jgi:hypothetical protein
MPDTPQKCAGRRIEPPVSEPSAANVARAATAVAEPDDEPPVTRDGSHALRQCPKCQLCPVGPNANSAMLSTANWIEPAESSRSSAVAVEAGDRSRTIFEPQLDATPRR